MKFINIELLNSSKGIPCELLLYLGKLSREKTESFIFLQTNNESLNKFFYNAIKNMLKFYKTKNIIISIEPLISSAKIFKLDSKLNIHFPHKRSPEKNIYIERYIEQYELLWGNLPYFLEETKFIDKLEFINDSVLQLSQDIVLH